MIRRNNKIIPYIFPVLGIAKWKYVKFYYEILTFSHPVDWLYIFFRVDLHNSFNKYLNIQSFMNIKHHFEKKKITTKNIQHGQNYFQEYFHWITLFLLIHNYAHIVFCTNYPITDSIHFTQITITIYLLWFFIYAVKIKIDNLFLHL